MTGSLPPDQDGGFFRGDLNLHASIISETAQEIHEKYDFVSCQPYVEGKGFTPAGQLTTEDTLRDHTGQPVHLHTIESTGTVQTVHNIEVNNTHTYHVATTGGWLLVHNGCRWDSTASRWRDTETGQFRTCPDTFTEVVDENGHVNFTDINQIATKRTCQTNGGPPRTQTSSKTVESNID